MPNLMLSRQPISFRYHNRAALVMSALQVEKNPLCAPGPCTPVGVHSNYAIPRWRLPAHAIHAALTLSPPRGVRPAPNSPKMKLRFNPHIHNFSLSHPVWMLDVDVILCNNFKEIYQTRALSSFYVVIKIAYCLVYFTHIRNIINFIAIACMDKYNRFPQIVFEL